jgi:peptidoglycan/xylan/chitin deacetylase (PgdA/CDA1 family)
VVIPLYHRVGPGLSEIELPASALDRQLRELAAHDHVITLDEAIAGGDGVVVTFDDGYLDFHAAAMPLLAEHGVHAVLYLATGLVHDGPGPSGDRLTWGHLGDIAASGLVTVGAHTHDHADLSHATEREADDQMRRNKELIEDRLGIACEHFAYPWAVGSSAADRVARRLFRTAALDAWRTNRAGRIDPHRLGRVPILRSDGQVYFRRKIRGQLDTEAMLYRALGRGPWGR